ncbi:MAG: tRNA epoxyqueuosine(34) reductase QueG [Phycisphaerae bacterium]|nr:tRNA epoxyqueuosine(34) reductase QueG [Phycisphaerae bacterium]
MKSMNLTQSIKEAALALGFDLVGVTTAEPISADEQACFEKWLSMDCAAGMSWMHRNIAKRMHPAALLNGARSVICTATVYGPLSPTETPEPPGAGPHGRIADYARLDDYHVFLKDRLFALADAAAGLAGGKCPRFKICVDSAPLAERSLARRAGLGFVGRNHMLTNERLGSQMLLGEIVTDLVLDADGPVPTACGDCNRCTKACPTGALRPDGGFDSARCISYLTIEHSGPIDPALAPLIGDRLFGCDECVLACPCTYHAPCRPCRQLPLRRPGRLPLREVLTWNEENFRRCFADSPVERLGLERLQRNARICLANADYV